MPKLVRKRKRNKGAVTKARASRLVGVSPCLEDNLLCRHVIAVAVDAELAIGGSGVIASKVCGVRIDPKRGVRISWAGAELAIDV